MVVSIVYNKQKRGTLYTDRFTINIKQQMMWWDSIHTVDNECFVEFYCYSSKFKVYIIIIWMLQSELIFMSIKYFYVAICCR